MSALIEGNVWDVAAFGVGFLCIGVRPATQLFKKRHLSLSRSKATTDFLNGITVVPFLKLIPSVFSNTVMIEAIKGGRLTMGVAGAVGSFSSLASC